MDTYIPQHRYDLIPSLPDHRNLLAAEPSPARVILPRSAACQNVKPVRNQANEGACTGFGIGRAIEIALKYQTAIPTAYLAAAFLYWQERVTEGTTASDPGAQIRDGLDAALKVGVPPEELMPYVAGQYTLPPSVKATQAAAQYKIGQYEAVTSLNAMKYAIARGKPVIIGFMVYPSFENVGKTGLAPMPAASEKPLGGHCICVTQYNDLHGRASAPNQWGTQWGDKGWVHLPYNYFDWQNLVFEAWTLTAPGA